MPEFKLDETSGLPVWIQLRNRLIYLIKTGYYRPGKQLPSVRSLAADLSINYNTVSKAYVDLEHSGYVTSVRGRGVFVRETLESLHDEMASAVDTVLEDAIRRCLSMGMSLDEVQLRMIDIAHEIKKETKYRLR
ncbi:MAG: GntR family transcriptional regulator [Slackia piriformis]|uniref:GntR family transcriptional regulator n=1 Tax=Slackia piriformis TaxID=626934 RepID=A0A943UYF5_9ACTN|nr:GntR family transcriptional regulator [Slackia piriformis]